MNRILFLLVLMMGVTQLTNAQMGKKKAKPTAAKHKIIAEKQTQQEAKTTEQTVSLVANSENNAYGTAPARRFSIADPTINALNQQAAGNTRIVSPSGVVGMPKRAYGFANGKILLRPTTAPSSGTVYGSGSVGTGTTIMGVGAGENALGVNGKNPYAGPSLWGSKAAPGNQLLTDSSRRH
jgi:hypothetical protein